MRILHTSDWHLGKTLEGFSRLPEQELFLEELIEIVERQNIELILLAGDIYDTPNPPATAEKLFYQSMKKLSNYGKRPIIVIAGNHDSPDRLTAASPLAYEQGIILLGTPKSVAALGDYGNFSITEAGEGYVKIIIQGQEIVTITLPYPSEKRLNEILTYSSDEEEMRLSYSQRVKQIFEELSQHYRKDTINLAMSHLYMIGGEECDSERQIQLGGSFAVDCSALPPAQYTALGHLHRPQPVRGAVSSAYYSGSPLQYSKSEINYSKCVYIVDVEPSQEPLVQPYYLKNYKPIEVWKCANIEEALERCEKEAEKDIWVYLEIKTDRILTRSELKALKDIRRDIVEIRPLLTTEEREVEELEDITDLNIMDLFKSFYLYEKKTEVSEEVLEMFSNIIGEEGEKDETIAVEDSGSK